MPNINRRRLLKAISAASAAAAIPPGASAAVKFKTQRHTAVYIDCKHEQSKGTATRYIINKSRKPLVLNGYQPVTIRNPDGEYTSLYLNTPKTVYTLRPGERLPVYANAVMTTSPAVAQRHGEIVNHSIAVV